MEATPKRPWLHRGLWLLVISAGSLLSCEGEEAAPAEVHQGRIGIVVARVTRQPGEIADTRSERFEVAGHFVAYQGLGRSEVEDLIGAVEPNADVEIDACTPPHPLASTVKPLQDTVTRQIELIDVGNITLKFDQSRRLLPARNFPDLMNLITGVIYAGDETQGFAYYPGQRFELHAYGSEQVTPFVLVGRAPEDLVVMRIGESDVQSGDVPTVERGVPMEIRWLPAEEDDGEILIELSWNVYDLSLAITCRAADDGEFALPAELTSRLPAFSGADEGEISLVRSRTFNAPARGLDEVAFRFVVEDRYPLRIY